MLHRCGLSLVCDDAKCDIIAVKEPREPAIGEAKFNSGMRIDLGEQPLRGTLKPLAAYNASQFSPLLKRIA